MHLRGATTAGALLARLRFRLDAGVPVEAHEAAAPDDEQARRPRLLLLDKGSEVVPSIVELRDGVLGVMVRRWLV